MENNTKQSNCSQYLQEYLQYKDNLKHLGNPEPPKWSIEKVKGSNSAELAALLNGQQDVITWLDNVVYAVQEGCENWESDYAALRAKADRMEQALKTIEDSDYPITQKELEDWLLFAKRVAREAIPWYKKEGVVYIDGVNAALKQDEKDNPDDWKTFTTEQVDPELLQVMQQASQNKEANWQALKEQMDKLKEGEKELTCQEANKACEQLDVCQAYGRCLRQNCTGLHNPEKEPVPQQGPVWVKASERLPEQGGVGNKVIVRGILNEQGYTNHPFVSYGYRNFSPVNQEMYIEYGSKSFLTNNVEWLDEGKEVING